MDNAPLSNSNQFPNYPAKVTFSTDTGPKGFFTMYYIFNYIRYQVSIVSADPLEAIFI